MRKFELLILVKDMVYIQCPIVVLPLHIGFLRTLSPMKREFAGNYSTSDNSKLAVRCLLICAYCMEIKNTVSQVALNMIFLRSFHTATATGFLLALIPLIASA